MKVIKVNDEVFWLVMGWNKTGQECMQDQNLLRIGNEKRFQLRERKKKRKRKNKRRSEDELSGEQGVELQGVGLAVSAANRRKMTAIEVYFSHRKIKTEDY